MIASVNGFVRETLLIARIGAIGGRAISTLALSVLIILLTWMSIGWIAPRSAQQAWAVGLTLAFEFLAGHYVFGNPWNRLLEDYNVVRGRIWVLVLLTTFVSPRLCAGLRNLSLPRQC